MLSSINLEIAPELRLTSYAALDDLLVLFEHWFIFLRKTTCYFTVLTLLILYLMQDWVFLNFQTAIS